MSSVAADQLRQYIERIERVEDELDGLKGDRKDIYTEAKGNGFDTKTLRQVIRLRKKDKDTRDHEDALLETYRDALGV